MTPPFVAPAVTLWVLLPPLIVLAAGGLVLLLDLLPPRDSKAHLGGVALVGILGALVVAVSLWLHGGDGRAFRDMVLLDSYALFFDLLICYAAALVVMLSMDYLSRTGGESGEYYGLVLFSTAGMMLMASAGDLIVVFLSLELTSLSLYVLAGLFKTRLSSGEASMKYFLLGAFATAFLLYGIALIYGATGSTNLDRIAAASGSGDPLLLVGLGLLLVGFGFKISSVPFHMWAPDVYEGAPTSITALIATGSKAAAFAALIRVLVVALRGVQPDWSALLWGLAVLTMTVGNVVALAQSNLKRMLAYSSIAHVGYMLMGLVAGGAPGAGAVLFYLLAYTFTTIGAFGAVGLCARAGEEAVEVGDYAGLARRHPVLAAALALFLLSLIGIPPLAGFVAKFYLFGSAVRAGYVWLTVIAVLNSAVAAYYYLRVIVYMYMRETDGEGVAVASSVAGGLALTIALVGIVLLGVMPAPFADLAQAAVAPLLR
jgi:NADH-quinone oxidoreductase subunit N